MKTILILTLVCVAIVTSSSVVFSERPSPDKLARDAYRQILAETDKNKDGKLSVAECKTMFKDSAKGEKNCTFWDANNDGTITEDEYVSKVGTIMRKR